MNKKEASEDLYNHGPGGFCESCGHFAYRHVGYRCIFTRDDGSSCACEGMKWQEHTIKMSFMNGPIIERD